MRQINPVRTLALSLTAVSAFMLSPYSAAQTSTPRIAVTDLSYQETVSQYFQRMEYHEKHDERASANERYRDSYRDSSGNSSGRYSRQDEISMKSESGYLTYIDRGELRKFTGDIKGQLIESGYRVVQGKPWTQKNTENLYDIIDRIKKGYYPNADYVLWGTIDNVEFRKDESPIQGSNAISHILSLELVAEFSLIDTKTYEVKAAFSAMGEGSDVKLVSSPGTRLTLNRSKVMKEVASSLGEAVAEEVRSQFSEGSSGRGGRQGSYTKKTVIEEKTTVYQ